MADSHFASELDRHYRGLAECRKDSLKHLAHVALGYKRQPEACRAIVQLICQRVELAPSPKHRIGLLCLADWLARSSSDGFRPALARHAVRLYSLASESPAAATANDTGEGRARLDKIRRSWSEIYRHYQGGGISAELDRIAAGGSGGGGSFLGLDVDSDIIAQFALNRQPQQQQSQDAPYDPFTEEEESAQLTAVPQHQQQPQPPQLTEAETAQLLLFDGSAGPPGISQADKQSLLAFIHDQQQEDENQSQAEAAVFVPRAPPQLQKQAQALELPPRDVDMRRARPPPPPPPPPPQPAPNKDLAEVASSNVSKEREPAPAHKDSSPPAAAEIADKDKKANKEEVAEEEDLYLPVLGENRLLKPVAPTGFAYAPGRRHQRQPQAPTPAPALAPAPAPASDFLPKQDVDMRRLAMAKPQPKPQPPPQPHLQQPQHPQPQQRDPQYPQRSQLPQNPQPTTTWLIEVLGFPDFPQVGVDPRLLRKTHETRSYIPDPTVCCHPYLIQGLYRPLFTHRLQPCIVIDGVLRALRFTGPPVTLLVDGQQFSVPTAGLAKLLLGADRSGQKKHGSASHVYTVALGGPMHEIIIDGKALRVPFNGPPVFVSIGRGGTEMCVQLQLPGPEPPVTALPPIPDQLLLWADHYCFGIFRPHLTATDLPKCPVRSAHVCDVLWVYREYEDRLRPLIQERLVKIDRKNRQLGLLPPLREEDSPALQPAGPGGRFSRHQRRQQRQQSRYQENQQQPVSAPPPPPPNAIASLFDKLVETGLISVAAPAKPMTADPPAVVEAAAAPAEVPVADTGTEEIKTEAEDEAEAVVDEDLALPRSPEPWERSFADFDIMTWRAPNPYALAGLYAPPSQCGVCGLRFPDADALARHSSGCLNRYRRASTLYRRSRGWGPHAADIVLRAPPPSP